MVFRAYTPRPPKIIAIQYTGDPQNLVEILQEFPDSTYNVREGLKILINDEEVFVSRGDYIVIGSVDSARFGDVKIVNKNKFEHDYTIYNPYQQL